MRTSIIVAVAAAVFATCASTALGVKGDELCELNIPTLSVNNESFRPDGFRTCNSK